MPCFTSLYATNRVHAIRTCYNLLGGLGLTVILIAAVAFSFRRADPDLWGHVQYGRDALQHGIERAATYTFTAEGYRWINHENACEWLFAWVIDQVGVPALLIFKTLCGLLVVGLAALHARRSGARWPVIAGSTLLLASVLAHFWPLRPQFLSYTLFSILVFVLGESFVGWQDRWHWPWFRMPGRADGSSIDRVSWRMRLLWIVPLIFFVWTNTHGAFLAGLAIYLAYLGLRACEAWLTGRRQSYGMLRRIAMMAAAAVIITFLNPYGSGLHAWLWETISQPPPEITEWQPLNWSDPIAGPFALLLIAVLTGCAFSRQPLDATHLLILCMTFWQAYSHWRHLPFFAILAAFWLPRHWDSVWQRCQVAAQGQSDAFGFRRQESRSTPRWQWGCTLLLNGFLAIVVLVRWQSVTVDRGYYPVSAIEFMRDRQIHGRLVVTFNWAQYALAALAAQPQTTTPTQISFDGRFNTCYPQVVIDQHFDFVLGNGPHVRRRRGPQSPTPLPTAILDRGAAELVLISRQQEHSVEIMHTLRDSWTLLYQDDLAQLWGRKDVFDDPRQERYVHVDRRELQGGPQSGVTTWPAIPYPTTSQTQWVRGLDAHSNAPASTSLL